jgi:hypothetical protein
MNRTKGCVAAMLALMLTSTPMSMVKLTTQMSTPRFHPVKRRRSESPWLRGPTTPAPFSTTTRSGAGVPMGPASSALMRRATGPSASSPRESGKPSTGSMCLWGPDEAAGWTAAGRSGRGVAPWLAVHPRTALDRSESSTHGIESRLLQPRLRHEACWGAVLLGLQLGWTAWPGRSGRPRLAATCGHRFNVGTAKWCGSSHMRASRGHVAVVLG